MYTYQQIKLHRNSTQNTKQYINKSKTWNKWLPEKKTHFSMNYSKIR